MAGLHLVTGYNGSPHITSADQGILNAYSIGTGDYVLAKGKMFEAQVISNNAVRIFDGCLIMNGRQVNLDAGSYLDAIITNGTQGMSRHDIIAIRYERNNTTGVESASLVVGAGTAGTVAEDPEVKYPASILGGAAVHDMPLYRVVLNGLTIEKVEPLFQVLAPMADIQHGFYKQNMLINGDFQCNQRGKKTYDQSIRTDYTVDMWRGYNVKVNVLNEGVKITGTSEASHGYFTQFIQLGKLKTTTYTIAAMADDKLCTFTVTPGGSAKEKDFGTFKISALTTSTWDNDLSDYNNKLKVNIMPIGTNAITFKYIDVFEGVVAYPHVKEDYATALMRCRRYIQAGGCVSPIIYTYNNKEMGDRYRFAVPHEEMANSKSKQFWDLHISYFDMLSETTSCDYLNEFTIANNSKHFFEVTMANYHTAIANGAQGIRVNYVITCEHNLNGD